MRLVAPSILSADFLHLEKDVEMVNRSADLFHLDIMDGTFVPNLSFGFPVVEAIAKIATKPLDVHLMIVHPEKYIERFAKAGADYISFHLEAIMSVFAGFGGQKFIEDTYGRVKTLKAEIDRRGLKCPIEVDGGVGPGNADKLAEAGVEMFVAGSSVFNAPDQEAAVRAIRGCN